MLTAKSGAQRSGDAEEQHSVDAARDPVFAHDINLTALRKLWGEQELVTWREIVPNTHNPIPNIESFHVFRFRHYT